MKSSLLQKANKMFSDLRFNYSTMAFAWIGIVLFVMSLVLTYMGNYIAGTTKDYEEVAWKYVMVNNIDSRVEENEWVNFDCDGSLDSYTNKKYYRLEKVFAHSTLDQVLYFETDHAPVLVRINGKDAYNNGFDKQEYVGNRYNAVVVPASNRDVTVDIYLTMPLSHAFNSHLETPSAITELDDYGEEVQIQNYDITFKLNAATVTGGIIVLLAVATFIFGLVYAVRIKGAGKMLPPALIPLTVGISVFLFGISRSTFLFNDPIWNDIQTVARLLIFAAIGINLALFTRKPANYIPLIAVYTVLCAGQFAPVNLLIKNIAFAVVAAVGILLFVLIITGIIKSIRDRIKYSPTVLTLSVYSAFTLLGFTLLLELNVIADYTYASVLLLIAATVPMVFCNFGRSVVEHKRNEETAETAKFYNAWIQDEPEFVNAVVSCETLEDFVATTVLGISSLVERAELGTGEAADDDNATGSVKATAALCLGGNYKEVYRHNIEEKCDYNLAVTYFNSTGSKALITDYYFDFIILYNEKPAIIFHFENIRIGMTEFIKNLLNLNTVVLETVFYGLISDGDTSLYRRNAFVALAENIERQYGSEDKHLSNVYTITKLLATQMGIEEEEADQIARAAMLHDIGKLAIPESILMKHDNLSSNERMIIDSHSKYGYYMLASFDDSFMQTAAQIALGHHCKDNKDFPEELDEIGRRNSQIVTVADVFDALTCERSYKAAWSPEQAFSYINSLVGQSFNSEVVNAMNSIKPKLVSIKTVGEDN